MSSGSVKPVTKEFGAGIRMAAQVVHAEARWQTEQRMRMATDGSRVRADEQFGYLLERLEDLEAVLLSLAEAVEPAEQRLGLDRP